MPTAGLDVFDKTLQITHTWLDEINRQIGPDRQLAWHVLGTVLRTIRDRLPMDLAAHLGAQLPLLVRGLYYDQWDPQPQPERWRSAEEFCAHLSRDWTALRPIAPEKAARAVFHVLNHYVDPGQVTKVREALPETVRVLWPESGPVLSRKIA